MTGKELVAQLRKARGTVLVPMLTPADVVYVAALKVDLTWWASNLGDQESGMKLEQDGDDWRLCKE